VTKPTDILLGTLDLLILRTLELGPLHGIAVADRIEQVTRGVFLVGPGSLFPHSTGSAKKAGSRANGPNLKQAPRESVHKDRIRTRAIGGREAQLEECLHSHEPRAR
jgi:hypothetical protein